VVAELVISPHYTLGSIIPALQEALREPYPRTIEATELVLEANAPPSPSQAWRLLAADQTRGVQIGSRAIGVHATSYSASPDFLSRWRAVLAAIEDARLGAYVERAGLRYIDLIVPTDGRAPNEYLVAELQGVPVPTGAAIQSRMWITSFLADRVKVQARTAAPAPEGMLLPPNFNALPLKKPAIMSAAEQAVGAGRPIGFVDTDCTMEVQQVFDAASVAEVYGLLHTKVSETFKSLISERARQEWV
jgi:uncharacterized protein (TIGR04255 family)